MKQGHIKISRKMFDGHDEMWDDGTPYDVRSAWIWVIQHAAFKPYKYRGVDHLERGEFVASVRFLAERFQWSKSVVHRWLESASKAGRIAGQRMGRFGKIYLIVKYETYQSIDRTSGTEDGTMAGTKVGQKWDKQEGSKAVKKEKKKPSPAAPDDSFPAAIYDWLYKRHWFPLFGIAGLALFRTGIKPLLVAGVRPGQLARGMHAYRDELDEAKRKDGKFSWFLENAMRHIAEADKSSIELFPETLRTSVFGLSESGIADAIAAHYARLAGLDADLLARVLSGENPPIDLPIVELAA